MNTTTEWPTEEDLIGIRRLWRSQGGQSGPYASYRTCYKCQNQAYCFGKTYEKQICFECFKETKRPKKRRRRAK